MYTVASRTSIFAPTNTAALATAFKNIFCDCICLTQNCPITSAGVRPTA